MEFKEIASAYGEDDYDLLFEGKDAELVKKMRKHGKPSKNNCWRNHIKGGDPRLERVDEKTYIFIDEYLGIALIEKTDKN